MGTVVDELSPLIDVSDRFEGDGFSCYARATMTGPRNVNLLSTS